MSESRLIDEVMAHHALPAAASHPAILTSSSLYIRSTEELEVFRYGYDAGVHAERNRCAKIADLWSEDGPSDVLSNATARHIAREIRSGK